MKSQYFGDVNDYRKYALLRVFARAGCSVAVHWMFTPDDGKTAGNRIAYLNYPGRWRKYDAALFDFLADQRQRGMRDLAIIESSSMLGKCSFQSATVPSKAALRALYFKDLAVSAPTSHLVFLDPDNGFEVASAQDHTKYVRWSEVRNILSAGKSILVYQHLPREKRETYIPRLLARAIEWSGARQAYAYVGGFSAFVLLPQSQLLPVVGKVNSEVKETWGSKLAIWEAQAQ